MVGNAHGRYEQACSTLWPLGGIVASMRCTDLRGSSNKKQSRFEKDHSVWGRKSNMVLPMGPRAERNMGLKTYERQTSTNATLLTPQCAPAQKELRAGNPIPDSLTPNVALHGISARLIAVGKWRSQSVVPLPIPAANLVGHAERIAPDLFCGRRHGVNVEVLGLKMRPSNCLQLM